MGHGERTLNLNRILGEIIISINSWDRKKVSVPLSYNKQGIAENCFTDSSKKPGFYFGDYHIPKSNIALVNLKQKSVTLNRNYSGGLFENATI